MNNIQWREIEAIAHDIGSKIISIRRDLHRIPELGCVLPKTRARILEELSKYDIDVREYVGNGGIVATLIGANAGPTVAYRADMDALPIEEENEHSYKSEHPGKMHACGHDGHVAIALGILEILHRFKADLSGNVRFIFQPAEEAQGGAIEMIADGALTNPKVDCILGSHIWPSIESGKIGLKKGPIMAGTDIFSIEIEGKGGHGGIPHHAVNPLVVASKIVESLTALTGQFIDSNENAVVSVCSVHGGNANNIIPATAQVMGTVRTFSGETQAVIIEKMNHLATNAAEMFGARAQVDYRKHFAPTINPKGMIDKLESILEDTELGHNIHRVDRPSMGAEDFSYFLHEVPGAYLYLGTRNESKGIVQEIHHPRYDMDEEILAPFSAMLSKLILELMHEKR
jgi:amidohydrolase